MRRLQRRQHDSLGIADGVRLPGKNSKSRLAAGHAGVGRRRDAMATLLSSVEHFTSGLDLQVNPETTLIAQSFTRQQDLKNHSRRSSKHVVLVNDRIAPDSPAQPKRRQGDNG